MQGRFYDNKNHLFKKIFFSSSKGTTFLLLTVLILLPILIAAQTINIDISVSAGVRTTPTPTPEPTPTPPPGEGGIGGYTEPSTKVIFIGKAYPLANLTISKNDTVIATFKAEQPGLFEREIGGVAVGTFTFSIFAEDDNGRKSTTISFTAPVLEGKTTTISGIFISPTIDLEPTQVEKGQNVNIFGQAFPGSDIKLFITSEIVKDAKTNSYGKWSYKLNTDPIGEGEYQARAKAFAGEGEQSPFSQSATFLVLKKGTLVCKGPDLNFDGKVNIIDFSILLYFWEQTKPSNRCADINGDGKVNIIDFSIMMYWWAA